MRSLALITSCCLSATAGAVPITVVGTTDLHGRVDRVPALAGYVAALRADKQRAVVLVDAGDMFQGTLESNPNEGESVVTAYNMLGYDAAAIGNHEFDFGPVGPLAVPRKGSADDPRGALKARAAQAKFPFLAANLIDDGTGKPVAWPNTRPSVLVEKTVPKIGKLKIGIIGVSSFDTPKTTMASNIAGLHMAPLVDTITREAKALRARGAVLVVLAAHAGGKCEKVDVPTDTSSCDASEEAFQVVSALPGGVIDVVVAGHTHQQVAHVVNGVPIVQAWANGKGFSRVDFDVDVKSRRAKLIKVFPPQGMCSSVEADAAQSACALPASYEGRALQADAAIARTIEPWLAKANAEKAREIGVQLQSDIKRSYDDESALGNLFADLLLEASPGADVALMNGGGIRADLPRGSLTYGQLFEMIPFDNRMAVIRTTGADLRQWLVNKLSSSRGGFLSIAGVTVDVICPKPTAKDRHPKARVSMTRRDGREIADDESVAIATTDFLASGGEDYRKPEATVTLDEGDTVRDKLERLLAKRKSLRGDDPTLFDPKKPRFAALDGKNPRCGKRDPSPDATLR